jgi:hypothetical protein
MPHQEAWQLVAQECPRRILAALHKSGEYRHGTSPRFPGKVRETVARGTEWAATGQVTLPIPKDFPTEKEVRLSK